MLLEATERLLSRVGWTELTTRKVAQLAGVSVGSLYQYFPDRDALMSAAVQRRFTAAEQTFRASLERARELPLREAVREVALGFRAEHAWEVALGRALRPLARGVGALRAGLPAAVMCAALHYAKQMQQERDDNALHSGSLTKRDRRLLRARQAEATALAA